MENNLISVLVVAEYAGDGEYCPVAGRINARMNTLFALTGRIETFP